MEAAAEEGQDAHNHDRDHGHREGSPYPVLPIPVLAHISEFVPAATPSSGAAASVVEASVPS
jgi:hypothetical protein